MTTPAEELFRDQLGPELRRRRHQRRETIRDTAVRAGISPQYLSEVERGLKDPSSEMLAAIAGALHTSVADVIIAVGIYLRRSPHLHVVGIQTELRRHTVRDTRSGLVLAA